MDYNDWFKDAMKQWNAMGQQGKLPAPFIPSEDMMKQQFDMQKKMFENAVNIGAQPITPEVIYMRVIQELLDQNKKLFEMVLEEEKKKQTAY